MSQFSSLPKTKYQNRKRNSGKYSIINRQSLLLFIFALIFYLAYRLIRLPDFPIYFFTDEAIQAQHAADLIANGFRSPEGILLPTYFENGGQYNLSLSVYVQVIPYLLFGKSIWVTRGTSVILTLTAAVSLALILRDHFKLQNWWLGAMLLSITPTWFLHSRTAFETVLMTSMYSGFLYFYLHYRCGKPENLYPTLLFGALAFYAYSPGQVIVVLTGLLLLITDAAYHWDHRKTTLRGLILLIVLAVPYIRFNLTHEQELTQHLTLLNSYWVRDIPIIEKIITYLIHYLKGFNPLYWFWPRPSILERFWPNISLPSRLFSNQLDLDRHTMKGYGHILWIVFPFFIWGFITAIKCFKKPSYRILILALLAAPSGAAVADWGITRGLVFVIPVTILTAIGVEKFFDWVMNLWKINTLFVTLFSITALTSLNLLMLVDALNNAPTWYQDYGLSGMQYGAQQVFPRALEIARNNPETTVLVSSTWANGTDVLMRYFGDDFPNLQMGNINAYSMRYQPLNRNILFIMTEEDLLWIEDSEKFQNLTIEETIPYPDGRTGFYFVRLEYVPNIKSILTEEKKARQTLLSETIIWQGRNVKVDYPALDINEIQAAFDGDPLTLIRTLEANPLKLVIQFSEPLEINQVQVRIGGTPTQITLEAFENGEPLEKVERKLNSSTVTRQVDLKFAWEHVVDSLQLEIYNPHDGEIAHVHLWEVSFE